MILGQMETWDMEEGVGAFRKKALVFLCSRSKQLPPCNHITPAWDGA
jgi:hypothetical protein